MLNVRFLPTCFFALNLALMLLNCLYCDGQQLATSARLATYSNSELPVEPLPPDCANEFGCPCRGATICQPASEQLSSPWEFSSWLILPEALDAVGQSAELPHPVNDEARQILSATRSLHAQSASFLN